MTPDAEPQTSTGAAKFTVILGGRFISEEDSGDMMGQPFSSLKIWGFNNGTKKYESVWAYTGSTSMMTLVGTSIDSGKTITYEGTYSPDAGEPSKLTVTLKIADDDHFNVKIVHAAGDVKSAPAFETAYSRKK
jgi:hypothetical protein